MSQIQEWVKATTNGAADLKVSSRAKIAHSTYVRQLQDSALSVENVVKIARAFGASVPDALIAHGIVTKDELSGVALAGTLSDATDQQLLDEMARRLHATPEGESEVFDAPNVGGSGQDAIVHRPDFTREAFDDELAVASERGADDGEDTNY